MTENKLINEFKEMLEQCASALPLLEVMEAGKGYSLKELKEKTGIDKAQISRWLSRLRDYEIVESETSSEDKRLKFFKLTKKGELIVEKLKNLRNELEKTADKEKRKKKVRKEEFDPYLKLVEQILNSLLESDDAISQCREKLEAVRKAFLVYLDQIHFWSESLENFYDKLLRDFGNVKGRESFGEAVRALLLCLIDAGSAGNVEAMEYIFRKQKELFNVALALGMDVSRILAVLIERYWKGSSVEELRKYVREYEGKAEFLRFIFSVRRISRTLYRCCGSRAEDLFLELLNSEKPEVRQLALEAIDEILNEKYS